MKTVTINRGPSTPEGTFSTLHFGSRVIQAVELPWEGNTRGESCIPTGKYRCELTDSPKFGEVYMVKDVPGRSHILIHSANFGGDEDSGFQTQLEGCIAPCLFTGYLINKHNTMQKAGLDSRKALAELMAWTAGEPFELTINQGTA